MKCVTIKELSEDLLNVENYDHMEEESQSSENSSDISEVQSVEIDRDINMDYGEEISDNNGYEVLEGTETVSGIKNLGSIILLKVDTIE